MDLTETGCDVVEWIRRALDAVQLQALENTTVDLWFPCKTRNLLAS
jgi:hypothetical protein